MPKNLSNNTASNNTLPRVTVLASGRGSNFTALCDGAIGYRVSHLITNSENSGAAETAQKRGIPVQTVKRSNFENLRDFKSTLFQVTAATKPDIVALAGFMVMLHQEFISYFDGRLINIHPSLLPDYAGLDTHKRVLNDKRLRHGCTVHFVDTGMDTGPRIAQAALHVEPSDTEEILSSRVLALEHRLYPWVVSQLCLNNVWLDNGEVIYNSSAREDAVLKGYTVY